ncbi:MAG: sugar ABC transporter permease [Pelagibacteraceae bacterium]|jgi:multiple sugar transport system permease protein|nr:sugar ABC transporter permease [Pelagibacteraceae bacterium]MBT3901724.1 sugar ABC transporter permease [Pelagibacteraceae bacterium]MBT4646577.1 sugar ABC transporter permease [Pelagibacteraceae bacterium]MBT4951771.1 sugar ABC transporter permease [Pelagibacteraceae bacterium]MBT5214799.1 sugar ABC transporter permease [Pelagibacteraceae bacterium]
MNNRLKSFNSPTFLAYALIAPAAIYILAIVAWPLIETVRLSFTNSSLAGEEYIGLENYEKMLGSKKFNKIVIRTFVWMFFSVSLKLIVGLIGAVLLNAKLPGRGMFRVLIMPPWVVPIAIGMLGWLWLYNGYFGIIAGVGMKTGILDGPFGFLAYKQSAFISTIIADVWVGTPMVTIFFLAAMQGVPKDLYEAAYCDGASRWHRFFKITLPQITPVIITMALLSAIWTFNSFEIIWILTEGGPRGATTTLIIDTYKMALGNYKFGKGAARAVVVMILLTVFAAFYMAILLKINKKVSSG